MDLELRHRQYLDRYSGRITCAQRDTLEDIQRGLLRAIESINYDVITGLLWVQTHDQRCAIDTDGEILDLETAMRAPSIADSACAMERAQRRARIEVIERARDIAESLMRQGYGHARACDLACQNQGLNDTERTEMIDLILG